MPTQIITVEDLSKLKTELLSEIKSLFREQVTTQQKWLRSKEVLKILGISANTLAMLRYSGKLPFSKIGGTIFFNYEDITKMMEDERNEK